VIAILGVSILSWLINRENAGSTLLSYGELMQILKVDDPSVKFQKVRASPTEVRGEIVTSDTITESTPSSLKASETRPFRTRTGFAMDSKLQELLLGRAGSEFVREDDESVLRVVSSWSWE